MKLVSLLHYLFIETLSVELLEISGFACVEDWGAIEVCKAIWSF